MVIVPPIITSRILINCFSQKELLLQEVDQLQAIEREIESYQKVSHPNLIKLVAHEVKKGRSNMKAFLIFPFYRVCGV